jgi:hypothetical protein
MSGKSSTGIIAAQMANVGSFVANSFEETWGERISTIDDMAVTINNLIIKDAFIYSFALSCSPLERCSEIKFTEPADIPTSAREDKMITRFRVAEKIPKSAIERARATMRVNKKPKKAEKTFPAKRIYVSFAVPEKARTLTLSIYFLTIA